MKNKVSFIFTILLSVVMIGVVFGVMTNSRNSILIKEVVFVIGGSLAALFTAFLFAKGYPVYKDRVSKLSVTIYGLIFALMFFRHFLGISSVNGPFTILANLSLAVLLFCSLLYMQVKHIRVFVSILLGTSLVVFIYAILQWQGVPVFAWDAALTRSGRSTGSMGNPNLLGGYASALIPLAVAYFVSMKKLSKTLKYVVSMVFVGLVALAVIASGTRGSIIGVFAGSLVFLVWYIVKSKSSFKKTFPLILGFILIALIVVLPMRDRLAELDSSAEDQGTLQVRKVIWSGAFELFTHSPLWGRGPGSFQILFPEVRNPSYSLLGVSHNTLHAHCEYLEILVDIGILGLIFWALLFYGLLPKLKNASLLQMAAFSGVIAMLAEALVSVHLRWPPTAWLFAMLLLVSLVKKSEPSKSFVRLKFVALVPLITAIVLILGVFSYYLPLLRSSMLVFKGKDIYLTRTEMAMNSAYSAANQWNNTHDDASLNVALNAWHGAGVYADSAVYFSQEAVYAFPEDLGAWYALGSAHLTKYMTMSPPLPNMQNVLNYAGTPVVYTQSDLLEELNAGMSAYNTLTSLAPNYAEVHNNLALGYSNLGDIDKSLRELYYSYLIHAHRREEYYRQVSALLTVYPNSIEGSLLYFSHTLFNSLFNERYTELAPEKIEAHLDFLTYKTWFLIACQPENADTLKAEFSNLVREYLTEDAQDRLLRRIEVIEQYSPYAPWDSGDIYSMSPDEALDMITHVSEYMAFSTSTFSIVMPDYREFYTYPYSILENSEWDKQLYDKLMDVYLKQIEIDRYLDDANTLVYSDRFYSIIDPNVADDIAAARFALGGSRTALREEIPMPWLEGSLPALISDRLHEKMVLEPLNSVWYEMELQLTFLLVTSYWWDYNIFVHEQNDYLISRVFYCRDKIREIDPNNWQRTVSQALEKEINRIGYITSDVCPSTIGLLRDDLVNGTPRTTI